MWTYKNADEKAHTFSCKYVQKRTEADKKRILSTSINQLTAKIALGYVTKPIGHSKQIMHAIN